MRFHDSVKIEKYSPSILSTGLVTKLARLISNYSTLNRLAYVVVEGP